MQLLKIVGFILFFFFSFSSYAFLESLVQEINQGVKELNKNLEEIVQPKQRQSNNLESNNQKTFINKKVQLNPQKNKIQKPYLKEIFEFAHNGNLMAVKRKIEEGTNIDIVDHQGNTALAYAAWRGHFDIAQYLIGKGANVNHTNQFGHTALHAAASHDRIEIMKLLVNSGAKINTVTHNGNTPLNSAIDAKSSNAQEYLISIGATVAPRVDNQNHLTTQNQVSQEIYYTGYAKKFQPIKSKLLMGQISQVEGLMSLLETDVFENPQTHNSNNSDKNSFKSKNQESKTVKPKESFLPLVEQASLLIDLGEQKKAIEKLQKAENFLKKEGNKTVVQDTVEGFVNLLGSTLTGNDELMDYDLAGYERVLFLNYKSIAYLILGDRKAYNVARRSIHWQKLEQRKFDEIINEIKKQEQAEKKKHREQANNSEIFSFNEIIQGSYKQFNTVAQRVPSAYVNPFGYYVAGMIQEFESNNDESLLSNSRISYQKGAELFPSSQILKRASDDIEKQINDSEYRAEVKNKKLIHIIVSDGFVPEIKTLMVAIPFDNQLLPIKLPMVSPNPTKVSRIQIEDKEGNILGELSMVADIEALALRHQKDLEPQRNLNVLKAIISGIIENQVTENTGIFGAIMKAVRFEMATPDTRAWMNLPSSIRASRIYLNKDREFIILATYDEKDNLLAKKTIKLPKENQGVIYARSLNKNLYFSVSETLWFQRP